MLYTLNFYSAVHQFYLHKTGKKTKLYKVQIVAPHPKNYSVKPYLILINT